MHNYSVSLCVPWMTFELELEISGYVSNNEEVSIESIHLVKLDGRPCMPVRWDKMLAPVSWEQAEDKLFQAYRQDDTLFEDDYGSEMILEIPEHF